MNEITMNYLMEKGSEILYLCYKEDINFPRSCGLVSSFMAYNLFNNEEIRNLYDVNYFRGHYRDDNEEDDCPYLDLNDDDFSECIDCSCDFIVGHSWIELVNKNTNKIHIIDLTSSQFSDDIGDLEVFLMENKCLSKSEVVNTLSNYGSFIEDINKDNYIRTSNGTPGEEIFNTISYTVSEAGISIDEFWKNKAIFLF